MTARTLKRESPETEKQIKEIIGGGKMSDPITLQELADKIELLTNAVMINKPVLSFKEAAVYTGLTEGYLYKLTSRQEISHSKPRGKMIYFNRDELDDWLQQNRVKSNAEIEKEASKHINRGASF